MQTDDKASSILDRIGDVMKEAKFFRKQNVIRGPKADKVFQSVNKAKKESRALQIAADGAMGRGSLKVVEKLPPFPEVEVAANPKVSRDAD